jgi:hypothetical protein
MFDHAQAGFVSGRSCADHILALETIIETRRQQAEPTYCVFIDIKKAFDSVDRNQLFNTMLSDGVTKKNVAILSRMYQDETSKILLNGKPGNPIIIRKGVRQGGSSSPVCFNFIPNELAKEINASTHCIKLPGGTKTGILLYADDIVLTAPNWRALRGLTKITEGWLHKYNLKINSEKSQVMAFGVKSRVSVELQGITLRHTPAYKYLGITKDIKSRTKLNQSERLQKMEIAARINIGHLAALRGVELKKKLIMAKACINSVGLYGTEATGSIDQKCLEMMERIQRRFARFLLGASRCAANETLLLDLDVQSIKTQIDIRTLKFREKLKSTDCDLMKAILNANILCNTTWEQRVGQLERVIASPQERLTLAEKLSRLAKADKLSQLSRLKSEVFKTKSRESQKNQVSSKTGS